MVVAADFLASLTSCSVSFVIVIFYVEHHDQTRLKDTSQSSIVGNPDETFDTSKFETI